MSAETRRGRSESGFTLIETALTCVVMGIVLAAAFPVVSLVFKVSTDVANTYSAVDQLALASEVVTRYVHEAVANAPGGSPFVSATADTATFYANTGNANGPEKVVAQVTTAGTIRSFKITLTPAVAGSCPTPTHSYPAYTCSYGASPDGYVLINYLTNGTGGNPVFTYTLSGGATCAGPPPGSGVATLKTAITNGQTGISSLSLNSLPTAVASGDPIVVGTGNQTQTVYASAAIGASSSPTSIPLSPSFTATNAYPVGTSVYDNACSTAGSPSQVSQISAVAINLQATKNPSGQPTGYQALAYLFSPTYNPTVG